MSDASATRRRWITLAEAVALLGLVIAALTLWNNWSERHEASAEREASARSQSVAKGRFSLVAEAEDGGRRLKLRDPAHEIVDIAIAFPPALKVATQHPVEPVIDRDWFAAALLAATDRAGHRDAGRLPVFITASYWDGDQKRSAGGTYDIIWRAEGRFLRGHTIRMDTLHLRSRGGSVAGLASITVE